MFEILGASINGDGRTISYEYRATARAAPFFSTAERFFAEYDVELGDIPLSLAVIPLVANVAPVAWFAGFDIHVPELDEEFAAALHDIRAVFAAEYPTLAYRESILHVGKLVRNFATGEREALYFSGGVDAFCSLLRRRAKEPILLTVRGADFAADDERQWDSVAKFNRETSLVQDFAQHSVRANMRSFLTHRVDLLLEGLGWWGRVQHGLALLCLAAPLIRPLGLKRLVIASSYSMHMDRHPWGSLPEIDEKVRFAGIQVCHDAWDLKRQDKIDLIVNESLESRQPRPLRVCYSEFKAGLNCGRCEKCLRTTLAILVAGGDPRLFGLPVDGSVLAKVQALVSQPFKSHVVREFWLEIAAKADSGRPYVFKDKASESAAIAEIASTIRETAARGLYRQSRLARVKHVLINRLPRLFSAYLRFRRKFVA